MRRHSFYVPHSASGPCSANVPKDDLPSKGAQNSFPRLSGLSCRTEADLDEISSVDLSTQAAMTSFSDSFPGDSESAGYAFSRFPDELDQVLLCAVCARFLCQPKECSTCQQLLCAQCTTGLSSCPSGCSELDFMKPSKFTLIFYMRTRIRCVNFTYGCPVITTVKQIETHEATCKLKPVQCANPVCIEPVREDESLCGVACKILLDFSSDFRELTRTQRLSRFSEIIQKAKKLLVEETKQELVAEQCSAECLRQEFERFLLRRTRLKQQLAVAQKYYHCGQWGGAQEWSCCGKAYAHSQGCQLLP